MKPNPSSIDIAEPEVVHKTLGLTLEQEAQIAFEDSADFDSLTPEQQKRRKNRESKRKERKGKNAAKAEANLAKAEADFRVRDSKIRLSVFWNRNRDELDEKTRAKYVALHEQCLDQLAWMWDNLYGTYDVKPEEENFYVSLEEGYAEMEDFIKERGREFGDGPYCGEAYGLLYHYDISRCVISGKHYGATNYDRPNLGTPLQYKNDWEFRQTFVGDNLATRIWLSCGLLTALPAEFVNKFRDFYWEKKRATTQDAATTPPVSA
jgi:hypothetical protein